MSKNWLSQEKSFTKWVNNHLKKRDMEVENIETGFMDGVKLINLYEIISEESLGKYYPAPKLKFHQIANLNLVVRVINGFVSSAGIKVQFSAEQIYEGDKRQILGMIWCLIHNFEIQNISEDELSAKEGLLLWCQKKTAGYKDVKVENFHTSWVDGLAFCALIHHHRPDLLDFDSLSKANKKENLELAFGVAERELDIPQLLETDDLLEVARPDEKVLMTYVAYFWKTFASSQKSEKASNIIAKNIDRQKELTKLQTNYEERAKALLDWIAQKMEDLQDVSSDRFGNSLETVMEHSSSFKQYKNTERQQKLAERLDLEIHLANVHSQQKNAGLPLYTPPEELSSDAITAKWNEMNELQEAYERALNESISAKKRHEIVLNRFHSRLNSVKQWQEDKAAAFASEDVSKYGSISALQARLKRIEIFAEEVASVGRTLNQAREIGQEIVDAKHAAADEISETLQQAEEGLQKVTEASNELKQKVEEALAQLETVRDSCLEFSRKAESLNLLLQEASLALGEPVLASSVSDVEVYETMLQKVSADIEGFEASLEELRPIYEGIVESGQDPSMYSSQNMDILSEKLGTVKEQFEQKTQEVLQEREKQQSNADLLAQFAQDCADYTKWTEDKKNETNADLEGTLQEQLDALQQIRKKLGDESDEKLSSLNEAYGKLEEADVAEQSKMSLEALQGLNEQLKNLIVKRIEGIEQQIEAEKAADVSEEQLEEFKKTFNHFDKDKSGALSKLEFKACLASLDEDVSDEDQFEKLFTSLDVSGDGTISFDEFLPWISALKREGTGYDDVLRAFEVVSQGAEFVTEEQLRTSGMAPEEVEFLLERMPKQEDGSLDYRAYLAAQYGL